MWCRSDLLLPTRPYSSVTGTHIRSVCQQGSAILVKSLAPSCWMLSQVGRPNAAGLQHQATMPATAPLQLYACLPLPLSAPDRVLLPTTFDKRCTDNSRLFTAPASIHGHVGCSRGCSGQGKLRHMQCKSSSPKVHGPLHCSFVLFYLDAAGGPKMRKWYGQESNSGVPRDGGEQPGEQPQLQVSLIGWHRLAGMG